MLWTLQRKDKNTDDVIEMQKLNNHQIVIISRLKELKVSYIFIKCSPLGCEFKKFKNMSQKYDNDFLQKNLAICFMFHILSR